MIPLLSLYYDGFQAGWRGDFCPIKSPSEFRRGYREGLRQRLIVKERNSKQQLPDLPEPKVSILDAAEEAYAP